MAETFFILQKKSADHGQFSNLGYNVSHPHLYLGRDTAGNERLIMSRVGNYAHGVHILIDGADLSSSRKYFIDHSTPLLISKVSAPAAAPVPPPPGIIIKPEIMVVLTDVRLKGNFREAVGTIFYLPDAAFDKKTPEPIKAVIKEGKEITIVTDVPFDELERHRTFLQQAYGFANLHNVRVPGALHGSKTITAEHTAPRSLGYVSQSVLDQALRKP